MSATPWPKCPTPIGLEDEIALFRLGLASATRGFADLAPDSPQMNLLLRWAALLVRAVRVHSRIGAPDSGAAELAELIRRHLTAEALSSLPLDHPEPADD
jgi:hypothetical protein